VSWMQKLCETYDYCAPLIGKDTADSPLPLLPVAHTTQKAHVEVIISGGGAFLSAHVIADKKESDTVIPCSEKAQNRTGIHPKNYPLFDKIQYLAGDYAAYGGEKGRQFYEDYLADLRDWCASPFANPRVGAALKYFERGTLVADLIGAGVLPVDEAGKPIRKWDGKYGEKRGVFLAGSVFSDPLDVFVRFSVENPGVDEPPLWGDPKVWDSYIAYYAGQQGAYDLCYVTGTVMPCAEMSPAKIRGTGDKAKLISSDDRTGFTYRGRFETDGQAARIGYDTTQKAHNALKWLIARQGYHCGDFCSVAWGTHNEKLPRFERDTRFMADQAAEDYAEDDLGALYESAADPDVDTLYAQKLDRLLAGYGRALDDRANVVVMGLDSATTGRLSIVCYEELSGSELLRRVRSWHANCAWPLLYLKRAENAPKGSTFVGAPAPEDIILAVYGQNVADKFKKAAVRQLMSCILESAPLPKHFMLGAVRRASNPAALDAGEYLRTLCIACALIRKYHFDRGENESMAWDENNHGRSYLFGGVLAYYHYIENYLLEEDKNARLTNAMRLKPYYSRRPQTTLGILDQKLSPYLRRLYSRDGNLAGYYKGKMQELYKLIDELGEHEKDGRLKMRDDPLDETYLLGFASKMNEFYAGKKEGE